MPAVTSKIAMMKTKPMRVRNDMAHLHKTFSDCIVRLGETYGVVIRSADISFAEEAECGVNNTSKHQYGCLERGQMPINNSRKSGHRILDDMQRGRHVRHRVPICITSVAAPNQSCVNGANAHPHRMLRSRRCIRARM